LELNLFAYNLFCSVGLNNKYKKIIKNVYLKLKIRKKKPFIINPNKKYHLLLIFDTIEDLLHQEKKTKKKRELVFIWA
jgi:hypothetical protein